MDDWTGGDIIAGLSATSERLGGETVWGAGGGGAATDGVEAGTTFTSGGGGGGAEVGVAIFILAAPGGGGGGGGEVTDKRAASKLKKLSMSETENPSDVIFCRTAPSGSISFIFLYFMNRSSDWCAAATTVALVDAVLLLVLVTRTGKV